MFIPLVTPFLIPSNNFYRYLVKLLSFVYATKSRSDWIIVASICSYSHIISEK